MRVVISGGGTGGHIYPALAVAAQLRDKYNADILYLGSDDGLEADLVPAAGFCMEVVKAGKLRRYISWHTFKGIGRVPLGMAQALSIVRKFRPHVAFTSGGYVAVPAGLAARLNGVPLLMHQQDVPPNLSNRIIGPLATQISVTFADSMRYFPAHKTLHLGNPVRKEILDICQITPQQARQELGFVAELPLLLVTGGSQGARYLNQIIVEVLPELLNICQILHISGNKLFAETQMASDEVLATMDAVDRQRYRLVPYMFDEMPMALQAAELVICRAGAATLSELAVLGKPSILVPLPPAIGGSPQEVNAKTFASGQATEVIRNADLKPELLVERVKHITTSPACLLAMANAVRSFAKPTATGDIVKTIVSIAKTEGVTVAPTVSTECDTMGEENKL
jgi:UDP-N-acetylglucosamine--N-acetylmuramyl-(pentapeptide) pyrophosphoryl-undecaprenol N-acetylglucosamine transferase